MSKAKFAPKYKLLSGGAEMYYGWSEKYTIRPNFYLKLYDDGDGDETGGWYMDPDALMEMAHECARLAKLVRKAQKRGKRVEL